MKKKKTSRKQAGLRPVKGGQKLAWLSRQDRNGWSLGLAFEKKTIWLTGLRFTSDKEVKKVLKSGIVFVESKKK